MNRFKVSFFAVIFVWATIPLMGGLFYWEQTLALPGFEHTLAQILILVAGFAWVSLWSAQAEYDRLRYYLDEDRAQQRVNAWLRSDPDFTQAATPARSEGMIKPGAVVAHPLKPTAQVENIKGEYYASNH